MTLPAFQSAFARLIAEPGFARRVRDGDADTCALTETERRRLLAAASDPGLAAATTVHRGWRYSKLLGLLPLTCAALGPDLEELARRFWSTRPPRSLYFQAEALAFARFVQAATEVGPVVRDVAAFEAGSIELDLGAAGGGRDRVEVSVSHDPEALLDAAVAGQPSRLDAVPRAAATMIGRRSRDGRHRWSAVAADGAGS